MSGVDSRIVTMKFDNSTFEQAAATTMSTMDKLKSALGFSGASKGLDEVQASANKMNFSSMEGGITSVSAKFVALATIGITALSNIASKAMSVGTQVAKSLTIDPIKSGFDEYELKMGSIQTIMAGSGENLSTVNKYLQELNAYSDKTIYSFKDMTSNIGKFTNAGVSLKDSVGAIQGIANVAARSGANAEEASRAMYNFAQSLSAGSVKLMDWKSIELANMATKEFKTQLLESAVASGSLTKGADGLYKTLKGTPVTATKGFNESLTEQWLTSKALVATLKDYSDTNTDIGRKATAAASDVKTFSQMMDTMKESAGSGWATSSELIFGNFEEAKRLWTGVNTVLGGMISASADSRNKVLGDWNALGGRTFLIEGIKNAFTALMDVLKPIKEAFRQFFPAKTGQDLLELTVKFRDFTENLKMGGETANNLRRTFKGVFAILSIVKMVIGGVVGVLMDLIGSATEGSGGFLEFTANIGSWLIKVERAIRTGQGLSNFFDGLGKAVRVPLDVIKVLIGFIKDLFNGPGVSGGTSALQGMIQNVVDLFSSLPGVFGKVGDTLQPFVDKFVKIFATIGQKMADSFSGENFDRILSMVNTGLFGGLVLLVKKFVNGGGIFGRSGVKDMFDSIGKTFGALTGQLTAMQKNVKADTMMKIAAAVGILTVSIVALSLIDSDKLVKSLTAVGVSFGMLLGAMAILDKIGKSGGFLKTPFITASMIAFSVAILILTAAVKNLSELQWEELGKGLAGVAGLMAVLAVAVKPLSANAKGMTAAGVGILALSVGLKVLATVVADFGAMEWGTIGKGLAGVAGALTVIAATMQLMPKGMIAQAVGIGIIAGALKLLATVVTDFGSMDWGAMGKGLAGIGGSLAVIAAAMWLMPPNMLITAASLVIVSLALQGIAKVIGTMGGMSWDEIGKGLKTLAGSLVILAAGLYLMTGSIAGSAALLVAAAALAIFTPVLMTLGKMPWGDIVKGLVAIAGVFLVVGLAGLALTPIIPVVVLLGLSLLAIGAGLALAGAGALAFATAIGILIGLGGAVTVVIASMLATIISAIPQAMAAFAQGIVDFTKGLISAAPVFFAAMVTIMTILLKAIDTMVPKITATMLKLLNTLLDTIVKAYPRIAQAGLDLLMAMLDAIGNNIYKIVSKATKIITEFIRGIGDNLPKVVHAGANMIGDFIDAVAEEIPKLADRGAKAVIKFINGVATAVRENAGDLREAGRNLAGAIIDGMTGGLASKAGDAINAAKDVASRALGALKGVFKSNSPSKETIQLGKDVSGGLGIGISQYSYLAENSIVDLGNTALDAMKAALANASDVISNDIDFSPVISPILDLSQVQSEAAKLSGIITTKPLVAAASFEQASSISESQRNRLLSATEAGVQTEPTVVKFEQNNYSPKALSPADVYRDTKSLLSMEREVLTR